MQKIKLVSQGPVSIAQGGVPVLYLGSREDIGGLVATTFNFLRSGCPEVEWLVDRGVVGTEDWSAEFISTVNRLVGMLAIEGEESIKIIFSSTKDMVERESGIWFKKS